MTDARYNSPMDASEALQAPKRGEGAPTPKPRIDYVTRLLVARLREAEPDRSVASIAEVAGISESSARRLLAAHTTDVKLTARAMMNTALSERLEDWERACEVAAEKGYHQPAKDWLEAAQVIDAKPGISANVNIAPTVNLTMGFRLGAIPEPKPESQPVIDVQPVPSGVD